MLEVCSKEEPGGEMSWAIGYDSTQERFIGYGVPSICDHPGCNEKIDRGLAYVCGGEPYGGDHGCGQFFCAKHLRMHTWKDGETTQSCKRCDTYKKPYETKPDTKEWINHMLTDETWKKWREENPEEVKRMKKLG